MQDWYPKGGINQIYFLADRSTFVYSISLIKIKGWNFTYSSNILHEDWLKTDLSEEKTQPDWPRYHGRMCLTSYTLGAQVISNHKVVGSNPTSFCMIFALWVRTVQTPTRLKYTGVYIYLFLIFLWRHLFQWYNSITKICFQLSFHFTLHFFLKFVHSFMTSNI